MRRLRKNNQLIPALLLVVIFSLVGSRFFDSGSIEIIDSDEPKKVVRYVDGDSLYLEGIKTQIRIWGIDAPEENEVNYIEARLKMEQLVGKKKVRLDIVERDPHGRILGRIYLSDGRDLGEALIASGLVWEHCRYSSNYYGTCGQNR